MRAADVMTPDPVCISPDASIADAIRLLLERKFSGLPVVDARGSLVGIVTEGDLLRRTETGTQRKRPSWIEFLMGPGRLATEYVQTTGRKVNDVMTPEVRTVTEDAPLDEIVHLMERHQIKRVLVVRDSKLVGSHHSHSHDDQIGRVLSAVIGEYGGTDGESTVGRPGVARCLACAPRHLGQGGRCDVHRVAYRESTPHYRAGASRFTAGVPGGNGGFALTRRAPGHTNKVAAPGLPNTT